MMNKGSFKSLFSFEFWQKFGKALMVVIAVMPAAGLMSSIGKSKFLSTCHYRWNLRTNWLGGYREPSHPLCPRYRWKLG